MILQAGWKENARYTLDFLSYKKVSYRQGGVRTGMAYMGRPKSEHPKKKILSVRVDDSLYQRICAYAERHGMNVTEVVLQALEKLISKRE